MIALIGLFAGRVVAQLIQALAPVPWLPPFGAWQGSALPYDLLVMAQIALIAMMVWIALRVRDNAMSATPQQVRMLLVFGGLYFGFMAFRLLSGLTVLSDNAWFAKSLPAFFHLVLASFVLLFADHLRNRLKQQAEDEDGATHD